jgi:hypothetical protein
MQESLCFDVEGFDYVFSLKVHVCYRNKLERKREYKDQLLS